MFVSYHNITRLHNLEDLDSKYHRREAQKHVIRRTVHLHSWNNHWKTADEWSWEIITEKKANDNKLLPNTFCTEHFIDLTRLGVHRTNVTLF